MSWNTWPEHSPMGQWEQANNRQIERQTEMLRDCKANIARVQTKETELNELLKGHGLLPQSLAIEPAHKSFWERIKEWLS